MSLSQIVITAFIFAAIAGIWVRAAFAQAPTGWFPDAQVPGYRDETFTPFLFADENRTVHALASQRFDDEAIHAAIVYRQWTLEGGWSAPNDILLSPVGNALIMGAMIDQTGMMHVAFVGGDAKEYDIYYANAPAVAATDARAWSIPRMVGKGVASPPSAALVGDDSGNLVIIFSGSSVGSGVYVVQSADGGETWTEEMPIFLTYDSTLIPFSLDMDLSRDDKIHAVWNTVNSRGVDQSLYYMRLDLATQLWSDPVVLDERIDEVGFFGPSFPEIVNTGDLTVVMYNSGNPAFDGPVSPGRPVQHVRISDDGGNTWRDPAQPFQFQLGRSGEHALVVDGNDTAHAVFMQRIENVGGDGLEIIDGPWHAEMRGAGWLEPTNFVATVAPHDLRAVISQGNVLLATWRQDPGIEDDGVWFTYRILDVPELPVIAIPTVAPKVTAVPTLVATPTPLTPTPTIEPRFEARPPDESGYDAILPLAIGLVPVVMVIVGVLTVRKLSHVVRRK